MGKAMAVTDTLPFSRKREKVESRVVPLPFRFARIGLVITLMAAPLAFGAVEIWAWAGLAVVAAVLLVFWAVGCVQRGSLAIRWSIAYVPAALLFLLGVAQLAVHLTLDPFGTWEALVMLGTDLVFFFLAGQLWADVSERAWKNFGLAVLIYAVSLSLFAIFQFFTSHGLLYWVIHTHGDVFGPYVNHNDYAGLMEILIPIALCYSITRPLGSSRRALLLFGVCGAVVSVLLSGSRGGMISVVVEMAILGTILWRLKKIRFAGRRGSLSLIGAAGVAALFLALLPASSWRRMASIAGLAYKPDATLEDRLQVGRDSLTAFKNYPLLGTGLGSFKAVFPQYQTFPTDLVWHHAHDDYLEALMETGIAGGLLILASLVLFFRLAFSRLEERLKTASGWIQLGAAIGCCGLLVHSFADFNLHIPANAAWFALAAGLAMLSARRPAMDRP